MSRIPKEKQSKCQPSSDKNGISEWLAFIIVFQNPNVVFPQYRHFSKKAIGNRRLRNEFNINDNNFSFMNSLSLIFRCIPIVYQNAARIAFYRVDSLVSFPAAGDDQNARLNTSCSLLIVSKRTLSISLPSIDLRLIARKKTI